MYTHTLLLSVVRPSIECGSEVWEGNKSHAGSLQSIILDGTKWILGCSKTCNKVVRGDTGLYRIYNGLKKWASTAQFVMSV